MENLFLDIPVLEIIYIIICLISSAFFSSSETALTSITRERALQILEEKNYESRLIRYWIENPNKILTLILIGNNISNIIATALVARIAHDLFHTTTITWVVTIMTFLILVFGEIFPKTIARAIAPRLAIFSLKILIIFYYISYPLTFSFVKLSQFLGLLFGIKPNVHFSMTSQKDLDFLIHLAGKEGKLIGSKGEYLKALSEFDDLKVRNIMIPKNQTTAIDINISIPSLLEIIKNKINTRYPVYRKNFEDFVGMLHVKDLLLNKDACIEKNSIASILRPIFWTNEYMKINDVLQMMRDNKSQLMLIKDEFNTFSGIITMEDILEELVGEISDEHDDEEDLFNSDQPNILHIIGSTPVHDLNEKLNMEINENKDYQTVNGFLLNLFNGILPQKNTIVLWKNFEIKILSLKNNSIDKIEVRKKGKTQG